MVQRSLSHEDHSEEVMWRYGKVREVEFITLLCPVLGLCAKINPLRASSDAVPDLIVNGCFADLKCQDTPFYRARDLYDIDPTFSFSINRKSVELYSRKYPDIDIYVWMNRQKSQKYNTTIHPFIGVWVFNLSDLCYDNLHKYMLRADDSYNAKDSYILDVRRFKQLLYIPR